MTQEELDKIVEQHQHWIKEDCEVWEDMLANLEGVNLEGVNLEGVNLEGANLECVNLKDVNLKDANLKGANLKYANLEGANLEGAYIKDVNLKDANLKDANLKGANLKYANLEGANLEGAYIKDVNLKDANLKDANLKGAYIKYANLEYANLEGANLEGEDFRLGKILTNPLTGYKKTKEGLVITAEIPKGAIVFCINGSKCRTNKAKITDMDGHKVLHSKYDNSFEYRLGQEIEIENFNLMYNVECASGFHFFRTMKEAKEYNG